MKLTLYMSAKFAWICSGMTEYKFIKNEMELSNLYIIVQIIGQPHSSQEILLSGEIRGGQPRVQLQGGGGGGQPQDCDSGGGDGGYGHSWGQHREPVSKPG